MTDLKREICITFVGEIQKWSDDYGVESSAVDDHELSIMLWDALIEKLNEQEIDLTDIRDGDQ